MTRGDVRECLTRGGRVTSEEEIDRFLKEIESGVPVMPVTFFCEALKTWARVAGEPVAEEKYEGDNKARLNLHDQAQHVFTQIMKSNLLWRMIYGGQKLREKPCPHHKGRWSGCRLPEDTECKGACLDGINVTGWLP
jgi:hypothetical protein